MSGKLEVRIKLAVQTRNAKGPIEIKNAKGEVIERRYLCLDFAHAFVQILRVWHWTKKNGDPAKRDPRTFEERMEALLDELFCVHKPLRSGYKAIAGNTVGYGEPDNEPKSDEEKAEEPVRVLEEGTGQLNWHI